jgi:hypothetical protein
MSSFVSRPPRENAIELIVNVPVSMLHPRPLPLTLRPGLLSLNG